MPTIRGQHHLNGWTQELPPQLFLGTQEYKNKYDARSFGDGLRGTYDFRSKEEILSIGETFFSAAPA